MVSKKLRFILPLGILILLLCLIQMASAQGGSISGTVSTPDGGSIPPGTKVRLLRLDGSKSGEAMVDTTNGSYSFAMVPPGNYILRAVPPALSDYTPSLLTPVSVLHDPVTVNLELTLPSILGTVYRPDGATPADAWVHVYASTGREVERRAAFTGTIKLGGLYDGSYWLQAEPMDLPQNEGLWWSRRQAVTVSSGVTQVVTLTLRPANVIGIAKEPSPSENPVKEAVVRVFDSSGTLRGKDVTDWQGRFAIGGLITGTYSLVLSPPWYRADLVSPDPITFSIDASQPVTNLGTIRFQALPKTVSGTVTTNTGTPVQNARVVAHKVSGRGRSEAFSDATGAYEMRLSPGLWALTVKRITTTVPYTWVYPYPPQLVYFHYNTDPEHETVDFTVITADSTVTGLVQLPGGSAPPFTVTVSLHSDEGVGVREQINPDGSFSIAIPHGSYRVGIHPESPDYLGPAIDPIVVPPESTYDLGTITLLEKNAIITGTVTDGTNPVEGIEVVAWRSDAPGTVSGFTDSDGSYILSVAPGTWRVRPALSPDQPYIYTGDYQEVDVPDGGTVTDVDFALLPATAQILGTLVDEAGNPVTDATGWARAVDTADPSIHNVAPITDGTFAIYVPGSTYRVRAWLPAGSEYLAGPPQEVTVSAGMTATVEITVREKTAAIDGGLYDPRANDQPVSGVKGEVFAWSEGYWLRTPIKKGNGTFRMGVASGIWALGYRVDPASGYVALRDRRNIPVQEGQTAHVPLPVVQKDGLITGTVLGPDGSPLAGARVIARGIGPVVRDVALHTESGDDGGFELRVPHGWYNLRAVLGDSEGYLPPMERQLHIPENGTVGGIVLQFRQPDATITGTVTVSGTAASGDVLIWAWSEDGAYTKTLATAGGLYTLNVISNTTWHIGAIYQEGDSFYATRVIVHVPEGGATQDLVLTGPHHLPAPVVVSFDADEGTSVELRDGTTILIPAGAMPVSGTVTLRVIPIATLPWQRHANVYRYGYALVATDEDGNAITEHFNQDVVITFFYDEAELVRWGITESKLHPAYYSTTTDSWTFPESYLVDTDRNLVMMQIDHFTTFALTGEEGYTVYLPLVLR